MDVTSRPQTLDELALPLEQRRELAREKGELWAVIVLTAVTPFYNVHAQCVTALVLNSVDDQKVAEFTQIAQTQSPSKALRVIELVGTQRDVALAAYRIALTASENVVEATVRLIDRIVEAQNESAPADSASLDI